MATALDLSVGDSKTAVVATAVATIAPVGLRVLVDDAVAPDKNTALLLLQTIHQVIVEAAWPYGTGAPVVVPEGLYILGLGQMSILGVGPISVLGA